MFVKQSKYILLIKKRASVIKKKLVQNALMRHSGTKRQDTLKRTTRSLRTKRRNGTCEMKKRQLLNKQMGKIWNVSIHKEKATWQNGESLIRRILIATLNFRIYIFFSFRDFLNINIGKRFIVYYS